MDTTNAPTRAAVYLIGGKASAMARRVERAFDENKHPTGLSCRALDVARPRVSDRNNHKNEREEAELQ